MKFAIADSGATFDPSGRYRYKLWRRWDASLPHLTMLMLNPSTADATKNDQTISSCIRLARGFGYGSIDVLNLFAFCATYPGHLKKARHPIGPENDHYILESARNADSVLLAWGNHGKLRARSTEVLNLLNSRGLTSAERNSGRRISQAKNPQLFCLGMTKLGEPRHPLYLSAAVQLIRFNCAEASLELCL